MIWLIISHLICYLHCLPFRYCLVDLFAMMFAMMVMPKFTDGRVHFSERGKNCEIFSTMYCCKYTYFHDNMLLGNMKYTSHTLINITQDSEQRAHPRSQIILFVCITKTRLYNFDPLQPHFYIVKLGFTGVYIIFLISAQNIDCGYSLEPPRRGGSNEYPQSMFWAEIWKKH